MCKPRAHVSLRPLERSLANVRRGFAKCKEQLQTVLQELNQQNFRNGELMEQINKQSQDRVASYDPAKDCYNKQFAKDKWWNDVFRRKWRSKAVMNLEAQITDQAARLKFLDDQNSDLRMQVERRQDLVTQCLYGTDVKDVQSAHVKELEQKLKKCKKALLDSDPELLKQAKKTNKEQAKQIKKLEKLEKVRQGHLQAREATRVVRRCGGVPCGS